MGVRALQTAEGRSKPASVASPDIDRPEAGKPEAGRIDTLFIGDRCIGRDQPTYVIAEIGINHNGDAGSAHALIDVAADAKVDAVKFQKRHLPSLYNEDVLINTLKYEQYYQYMIPILKEVELADKYFFDLRGHAIRKGLEFLCTPFDPPSVDFLVRLGVRAFKTASADLTNHELLDYVADREKPMLVSTGMSHWEEIVAAAERLGRRNVPFALMHCRSAYPVRPREVNLKMIHRLGQFGRPVGYSGHDIGTTIPLVATGMGAGIIEKHITLDRKSRGPDHKISLEPDELKQLVRDIRVSDQAVGRETRYLLRGEIINREVFGKSLIAENDIRSGTRITRKMMRVQGPGKGLSPGRMNELIGRTIHRSICKGDYFTAEDLDGPKRIDLGNSFRSRWGLITRFSDMADILSHCPKVVEFHLAEKDFRLGFTPCDCREQNLVVHAPEYIGDHLLDLCSDSESVRSASVELIQKTIALARTMAPHFNGIPKVIAHPGAMSLNGALDRKVLEKKLKRSLKDIRDTGVELLIENLPPYPWYFGGQWRGNFFMDPGEIHDFCDKTDTRICFDLSHAALFCNAAETDLGDFIETVKPYIRHIHFADAYGLDGEGVQIGQGDIDFKRIMPLFSDYRGTWVPEIWRGHLQHGKGFIEALTRLRDYDF